MISCTRGYRYRRGDPAERVPGGPALACGYRRAEGEVGDAAGTVDGLDLETVLESLQTDLQPLPAAQHDRHHGNVGVVDQAAARNSRMVDGPPPMRRSPPAAAWRACASAGQGWASRKLNAVPPLIRTEGRDGGSGKRPGCRKAGCLPTIRSLRSGQAHGAGRTCPAHDLGADARRPGAGESVVDAGAAVRPTLHGAEGRVGKNHSCSRVPACPNGACRLCPSPVPNPSSDTEKLCTRTCGTMTS